MRAGQLGVQDEAEAWIVLTLLVPNLDVPVNNNSSNSNDGRSFFLLEKLKGATFCQGAQ